MYVVGYSGLFPYFREAAKFRETCVKFLEQELKESDGQTWRKGLLTQKKKC